MYIVSSFPFPLGAGIWVRMHAFPFLCPTAPEFDQADGRNVGWNANQRPAQTQSLGRLDLL